MGDRGIGRSAAVLLVLFACALCGCGEGTRQTPPAASPPVAARSFNSKVPFLVWIARDDGGGWEDIGTTPAAKPIEIPACWAWGVTPEGGVDIRAVAQEIVAQKIPGLRIESAKNDDLAHLKNLKRLRWLDIIYSVDITDAGLLQLKGLKELQRLVLLQTQVTDAGLVHLVNLKGLLSLSLRGTEVTDTGLVQLTKLKGLQHLELSDTKITNAGLVHLKGLQALRTLGLDATEVTEVGVEEFKQAMPNVEVQH